jgi:hypothetical protein
MHARKRNSCKHCNVFYMYIIIIYTLVIVYFIQLFYLYHMSSQSIFMGESLNLLYYNTLNYGFLGSLNVYFHYSILLLSSLYNISITFSLSKFRFRIDGKITFAYQTVYRCVFSCAKFASYVASYPSPSTFSPQILENNVKKM